MNAIGIIPARFASTRFPGKPLIDLGGKSMIQRVYEQALKSDLDDVYIATDHDEIYNHVLTFGKAIMTSDQCENGTERIAEALNHIENKPDIIINIQGDEPFIHPDQINLLLTAFFHQGTGIATLKKKIEQKEDINNPNIVKVVVDKDQFALYFSRFGIPFQRKESDNITYYKHIGLYGFRTHILSEIVQLPISVLEQAEKLEQLRWLDHGYLIKVLETQMETIAIDTPHDYDLAKKILKA